MNFSTRVIAFFLLDFQVILFGLEQTHLLFLQQSLPWLKFFIILLYFLGRKASEALVRDLLIPASSSRPPTSHATRSMHSSLCSTAMYMSCTLSIMLFMGFSSPTSRLFLTATVVTEGKSRARPAMIKMGIRRVERSRPPASAGAVSPYPWSYPLGPVGAPYPLAGAPYPVAGSP